MREWYPRPLDECDIYMERLTRFELARKNARMEAWCLTTWRQSHFSVAHYLVFNELFLCATSAMLVHMLYINNNCCYKLVLRLSHDLRFPELRVRCSAHLN